jgi:alkyl hydroperoxide reductase subunit AhpC
MELPADVLGRSTDSVYGCQAWTQTPHEQHGIATGLTVDETLRVRNAVQTGGRCAMDWQPGQVNLTPAARC